MIRRRLFIVLGIALVAAGVFIPTGWLVPGAGLSKAILALEGLVLIAVGATGMRFTPLPDNARLSHADPSSERDEGLGAKNAVWLLGGVTLVALTLRLINLGNDLWLDEIGTVRLYASGSVRHILSTYHDQTTCSTRFSSMPRSRCSASASGRSGFQRSSSAW